MKKILLYSKNKKNINKIIGIQDFEGFNVKIEKIFDNLPAQPETICMIILDITSKNEDSDNHFKNIINVADKHDIAKLVILNPDQTDFLLEDENTFDDFIFDNRIEEEFLLRIKLIIQKKDPLPPKNAIVVDRLILDTDKYELKVDQRPIEVTFKEFELLKILLQNQNKVFTRNKLLSAVWEYDFYGGSRTVDVHMRRLRSKIPPPYNLMLKTVRNVGYMFSPQI
ncbi:MAG TPA: response regulator transcription factor [Candidatus Humimicrobiaceae bacterium]